MYEIGEEIRRAGVLPQPLLHALRRAGGPAEGRAGRDRSPRPSPPTSTTWCATAWSSSSGAVRNHDPEIMVKAFELVRLGEEDVKAKFPAMYNAFTYGAPPHAGIAPGVDRMVMLLAGEELHPGDHPLPHEQERPGCDDERPQRGHAETIGRAAHRHRQAPGLTCKSGIKKRRTAFLRSASFPLAGVIPRIPPS